MDELLNYPVIYEQTVAWGDMDAFGHVNNVIYYRYMESARIAYFDQLNIFTQNIYTVVSSNQCQYLKPVFYPDRLKIAARVDEIRNSAMRMHYILWSEKQNAIVATGDAVIVFVDPVEMKKTLIPIDIKEMILSLEQSVNHELS
ncbi:acyl-CoA thioesterase [Acinetobacter sp. ANC 4648]|uniref:acyl-CoA thioesterase n=1 Tax=Acinetobacter sp. ANC 4648 TaxID=1977875 RepID=UPI000A3430B8|nr:thioesterase family protein [Acinetobacter sp. ANC 4648]OTG81119.1 thioesterase [Acinetobacter sp. ANC 4648]